MIVRALPTTVRALPMIGRVRRRRTGRALPTIGMIGRVRRRKMGRGLPMIARAPSTMDRARRKARHGRIRVRVRAVRRSRRVTVTHRPNGRRADRASGLPKVGQASRAQ